MTEREIIGGKREKGGVRGGEVEMRGGEERWRREMERRCGEERWRREMERRGREERERKRGREEDKQRG